MALSVKNISKKIYGRSIVNDVSFEVNEGEIVGLLGPNGAGKSTSFYITAGLLGATAGKIILDGQDISNTPAYKRAQIGIVYLPQESSIFQNMTVEENITVALESCWGDAAARKKKLDDLLEDFAISHIRKTKGIALSGGERRRVEIARCIAMKPRYVLLDEPFAGIDPIAISSMKNLILKLKKLNVGILITDHNVKDALSIVERGYVIFDGKVLAEGSTIELINNPQVEKLYLGESLRPIN